MLSLIPILLLYLPILIGASSCYSLRQINHQGNLLAEARPVRDVMWREDTDPNIKKRLQYVQKVLAHASAQELNVGRAYRYYVDNRGQPISYLVQAAQPYALEFKKWWFPVIGDVPYLGFYDQSERDRLAQDLRHEGLDVSLGESAAFSSLGFYPDPIFSSMLARSDANIAQLLFHELTHRTLWISGAAEFNENLAEFVGDEMTKEFLQAAGDEEGLKAFLRGLRDEDKYRLWVKALRSDLETLYKDPKHKALDHLKSQKGQIFKRYLNEKFPQFESPSYQKLKDREWNNASVMAAAIYIPDEKQFKALRGCLQKDATWGVFLARLGDLADAIPDSKKRDADAALADLVRRCPLP